MLPNFFIIGAPKAGTSSLHAYLGQHHDVFTCPIKEPNYFALAGREPRFPSRRIARAVRHRQIWRRDDYEALFERAGGARAVGESSSWYLHSPTAAGAIRAAVPDARLIVVLRDPVERAFSAYRMAVRIGLETAPSFRDALALQEERRATWNWGLDYETPGFYTRHLRRYVAIFPRSQVKVLLYEDLLQEEHAVLADSFRFLGVCDGFRPDTSTKHNVSVEVGSLARRIRGALRRVHAGLTGDRPFKPSSRRAAIEPAAHRRLQTLYRDDVLQLQDLIERDLAAWLEAR